MVDTSALIAILQAEADAERFAAAIAEAESALISAATVAETGIVMLNRYGPHGADKVRALIQEARLKVKGVTEEQAELAIEAYGSYGKGQDANLNFGDCFAYALAKVTGLPLLFKGGDFSRTDIEAVLS